MHGSICCAGLTQAGIGKLDEADMLLGRSLVIDGQFDHPLTCVALLEQGRMAMVRGDSRRAGQLLAEAGFSAYYFENWDVLTESVLLGWINHMTSGGAGVYPPLEPVAAWAQVNRLQHIAAKLRLAQAESLLWLGQLDAGGRIARRRVAAAWARCARGLPGIHQLYVQAAAQIDARANSSRACETLLQALAAQADVSLRNFQIGRTNEMYDCAGSSRRGWPWICTRRCWPIPRRPTGWCSRSMRWPCCSTPHDAAFDRWFIAALERKDMPLALEIAERAKRRRFLASQPLGGRLAALRSILEAPEARAFARGGARSASNS